MPMKVTVCFEKVKVLVPCGDGEILVRELIEKAITRYKKAIGKSTDYWVSVHTIRTVSEDSILDPDDTLLDVVDDREQLIADFEEQGGPRVSANGDGQSASSAGTASPDIFQTDLTNHTKLHDHNRGYSFDSGNDVIVTSTDIHAGSGLTVRRGSEPNLNVLDDHNVGGLTNGVAGHGQDEQENNNNINQNNEDHKPIIKGGGPARAEKEKTPPFSRFARDSWRQSLGNQPNMYKWLEAQERQEDQYKSVERQGPVGGATSPEQSGEVTLDDPAAAIGHKRTLPPLPPGARAHHREVGILIALKNDGTPLGIHVVPDFGEDGRETGLMVQGIEPGGRIDQDGRLKVHDRIIEINSQDLHNMTFPKAQEIFRNAMKTDVVNLKIVKHSIPALPKKPPPAVLPKPRGHSPVKPSPLTLPPQSLDIESPQSSPDQTSTPMDQSETVTNSNNQSKHPSSSAKTNKPIITSSPIKPASPVKKAPPPPPTRHPKTSLSANENSDNNNTKSKNSVETGYLTKSPPSSNPGTLTKSSSNGTLTKNRELIIAPTNTKKIGKRVVVELVKGDHGLGFSITTRDNTSGGPSPIYIKNIQPQGAAVTDGRLKAGDRLLEVNGAEMTDVTQTEAVTILRNCPRGSPVTIVVSRQVTEEVDEMFKVPRELPAEKAGDDGTLAVMKNKELIEFDIPLNDTGSAGLGVSVKGKTLTTEEGTRDLGIFVKAVMQGGAASKDGRLQVNDQLLEVNQSSLIQRSNMEAMDILRNAMQEEGLIPGSINIKVARRIGAPSPSPFSSPGSPDGEFFGDVGPLSKKEENNNNNFSLGKSDNVTDAGFSESPERTKNGNIANMSNFKSPNLFLDRVMAGNGLRNMSYTRATHDSYVESPEPRRSKNIINLSKQRPRPHSTIGIERGPSPNSSSDEDTHKEPAWLKGPDWTRHASQTSEESELSPSGDGFARDAFGRQSMSEKRKGHGDPRSSEIYQKVKGLKELNKANIRGPGPPSNLKRFSSLENLTTMQDADADMSASFDDDDASPPSRMARRRGGNESFRCAVDRSYDPVPHLDMAPQTSDEKAPPNNMRRSQSVEEEGSEGGSGGRDPTNSARSSVSDTAFNDDPWGKKKGNKKQKEARRSGGLLKGFFKFGRGRKTPVDDIGKGDNPPIDPGNHGNKENIDVLDAVEHKQHIEQQEQLWKQAQLQQERNEAEFRRLQEQHMLEGQKQRQQVSNQQSYNPFPLQDPEPHSMGHSAPVVGHRERDINNPDQSGLTRAEKIQQLRADHQRRHQARQGQYPQEDKEEEYEKMIQEDEKKADHRFTHDEYFFIQKYGQSAIPSNLEGSQGQNQGRGSRPSSRNQAERPNSRGVGGSVGEFGGPGTSNYTDYSQLPPQPGSRHISDSNITKYGYHRPPSRGALVSDNSHPSNFYQPQSNSQQQQSNFNPHNQQQHSGIARGPTPNYERQFQHQGIPRGMPPTNEHDRNPNFQSKSSGNINNSNSSHLNFHPAHRGPTPPNVNQTGGEKWYYSEDGDPRLNQKNVNQSNNVTKTRDHVTRQEVMPPSGQGGGSHFGNSAFAYRDPVYTAMAGKRPVKTLSTQPNSAKV